MKIALLSLLALLKPPLVRLLSSMKFQTFLLGVITTQAAKHGLEVDPETYWTIVGFFALLLGAQGLNDIGKGRSEVETRNIQSGFAQLRLLWVLALAALWTCVLLALVGCSWLKSEAKTAGRDVVDCMKPELLEAGRELGPVLDSVLVSLLSDQGKVDREGFKAVARELKSDAAGCAVAAAVKRLSAPRGQDSQASPLAVDVAELQAAWDVVRRERFGGRSFAVGGS